MTWFLWEATVRTGRDDLNQTNLKRQGRNSCACHRVTVIASQDGLAPGQQRPHGVDPL